MAPMLGSAPAHITRQHAILPPPYPCALEATDMIKVGQKSWHGQLGDVSRYQKTANQVCPLKTSCPHGQSTSDSSSNIWARPCLGSSSSEKVCVISSMPSVQSIVKFLPHALLADRPQSFSLRSALRMLFTCLVVDLAVLEVSARLRLDAWVEAGGHQCCSTFIHSLLYLIEVRVFPPCMIVGASRPPLIT